MGDITVQRGIPGIGEFQCYDKFMLESLRKAAEEVNEEEWCASCYFCFCRFHLKLKLRILG